MTIMNDDKEDDDDDERYVPSGAVREKRGFALKGLNVRLCPCCSPALNPALRPSWSGRRNL